MKIWIKQATADGSIAMDNGGVANLAYPSSKTRRGRVIGGGNISPTITAQDNAGGLMQVNVDSNKQYRIRRLTPRETWRLMNFTDEQFDKAKYERGTADLIGGMEKCSAKLMAVQGKPQHINTGTYVSCIIKDSKDMGILETIVKNCMCADLDENIQNVNIAIEKLDGMGRWGCATNIIKCIDFMGMHCILIQGKDQQIRDIIVSAKQGNTNTEKYMKITTESNLDQNRLYTILILIKLIIESKIFGSTTQELNITGRIMPIEIYENSIRLKILNLSMEYINQRMSDSALYKQAGNSIVVGVLEQIMGNLYDAMPYLFDDLKVSSYFSGIGAFESALDRVYEKK